MGHTAAAALDPRVARSRAKILAAATELIVEGGTAAATADAVAERAGVSKATMYRHWSSQIELLIDAFRSNVPEIEPPAQTTDYRGALQHLMDIAVENLSRPEWKKLLPAMLAFPLRVPEAAEIMQADTASKQAAIEQILELGRAAGERSATIDADSALRLLFGPLIFDCLQDASDPVPEEDRLRALADIVLERFLGDGV